MRRSTSAVRRACAVGTTVALIGLTTGLGIMTATSASAATGDEPVSTTTSTPSTESTSTEGTSTDTTVGTGTPAAGSSDAGSAAPAGTPSGSDAAPGSVDTGTTAPGTDTDGAAGSAPSGDAPGDQTSSDAPGTTTEEPGTTDAPGATTTDPATPTTGTSPEQSAGPTATTLAAAQTVTIDGDPSVGSELVAKPAGFTPRSKIGYRWTDDTGAQLSDTATYTVGTALAGRTITVTVEGDVPGEEATTTSTPVPPVFVGEDGTPLYDDDGEGDPYIEAKAGEPFSYTFRALSTPAPTLSISSLDDEGEPQSTLPAGVSFDASTGVLSGTLTKANTYYDFTVTATVQTASGPATTDQYASVTVDAGAPVGIEVFTADRAGLTEDTGSTTWIVRPNGDVYTLDADADDESDAVKGGHVTVAQGGTLLIAGTQVDRFGNEILPEIDEDTDEPVYFTPTVTSDVATDVIGPDPDLGDVGVVDVTFPHASTHTLTVSGASLPSTVFAVDVRPAAVPTVPAAVPAPPVVPAAVTAPQVHHVATGRLAYTGADESTPIAWALGFLVAGAGLIGARALRRRRARR